MNAAIDTALRKLSRVSRPYVGESGQRQVKALCPFHDDTRPSFGVNIDSGEWNCLAGCGGGWIDTLLLRLGYTREEVKALTGGLARPDKPKGLKAHFLEQRRTANRETVIPEEVLDLFYGVPEHMLKKGWSEEILMEFEVGWDRGAERITYPIRDAQKRLIAISGRTPYDRIWPKYSFYGHEDLYGFVDDTYKATRANLLYNIHRAMRDVRRGELVPICEGFKEILRLHEAGITGVALTGSMYSGSQIRLLNSLVFMTGCTLVVILDNDKAGHKGAPKLCKRLSRFTTPRIAFTTDVKDVSEVEDLKTVNRVVRKSKTYFEWTLNLGG